MGRQAVARAGAPGRPTDRVKQEEGPGRMSAVLKFCPRCGTPLSIAGQLFCASCGLTLPGPIAPSGAAAGSASGPAVGAGPPTESVVQDVPAAMVLGPAATSTVVSTPARAAQRPLSAAEGGLALQLPAAAAKLTALAAEGQTLVNDWSEVGAIAVAALFPFMAWLAMSLVAGFLFADIFGSASSVGIGSLPVLSTGLGAIGSATYGLVASLFGGLGYHLGVGLSGGALGVSASATAGIDVSATALGALSLTAVASFAGIRASLRRQPRYTRGPVLVRLTLASVISTVAIFLAASLLGSLLGGSFVGHPGVGLGPFSVSGTIEGALRGGPTVHRLPALFLAIWTGAFLGGTASLGARRIVGEWLATRGARFVPEIVAAIGGSIVAMAILGVAYLIACAVWWVTVPGDVFSGFRLLPAFVAYLPNWIGEMAVLATGTPLQTTDAAAAGGSSLLSIWSLPAWLIALGIATAMLPGFIAGVILRGRDPRATPGHVVAVAVGVVGLGMLVAALALPGIAVSGSAAGQLAAQKLRFTFDARQVILVGGITTILTSFLGFQVGARLWRPMVRLIPALAGDGPEPVHFR